MEKPTKKFDDLGIPYFRKPSNLYLLYMFEIHLLVKHALTENYIEHLMEKPLEYSLTKCMYL